MTAKYQCWRCGHELGEIPKPMPRLEQCPACKVDLHVCRFCRYYKPSISGKCDHDLAEPAREVDLANFCHYFRPSSQAFIAREADKEKAARDKLAALFGDENSGLDNRPSVDDPLEKMKSLFNELPADKK